MLRERSQGYSRAVDLILQDLDGRDQIPPALLPVVGAETETPPSEAAARAGDGQPPGVDDGELERVLFTKPWNQEQVRIASRLDRFGCVLVQGPPGTGKTHTIANLIGHLLAHGKSVLVTAHSSKALSVLREQIVDSLRPLAVSVLDNDLTSRQQLEEAVHTITSYLSTRSADDLHHRADQLEQERRRLLREISALRQQLAESVESEYRAIVVSGREYYPSRAARLVQEGVGVHDWIPGPVHPGAALPLSSEELAEVYRLNQELPPEDEREMAAPLPDPATLPGPERVDQLVALLRRPVPVQGHQPAWWSRALDTTQMPELERLAQQARVAGQELLEAAPWELALIDEGDNEAFVAPYESLFHHAMEVSKRVASAIGLLAEHRPELAPGIPLAEQERLARDLAAAAARRGGRLGWPSVLFHSQRRRFMHSTRVAGARPITAEHFQALAAMAAIQRDRDSLRHAWQHLITHRGGPDPDELGAEPERSIARYAERLRRWLHFRRETLVPLRAGLQALGFVWERAYKSPMPHIDPAARWQSLGEFLLHHLPVALEAQVEVLRMEEARRELDRMAERLKHMDGGAVVAALRKAVRRHDPVAYRAAYQRLVDLHARRAQFWRREELLARLEPVAPGWAVAIRQRQGVHGGPALPGDPEAAWTWRQFHEELARRGQVSVQELQHALKERGVQLRRITAELVECRAWAYRLERTTPQQRQALIGWLNTMHRLGRGTGKQAPRLRAEAARQLARAKDAVPVWIMPLARVAEQFDPRTTRFDVVIIDEASQCDVLGLVAVYLGRQVVVVGDHEQVSPEGVGQELERINALQAEFLRGIPNAHLYDGRRSIYDIARESFGGTIMLVEHFRCVPEIIQFSNTLSYQGRIRPLRESSQVPLKPHVVPYRVRDMSYRRRNEAEAQTIASLVAAMTRHPAYRGKSLGVISMVGDEQPGSSRTSCTAT